MAIDHLWKFQTSKQGIIYKCQESGFLEFSKAWPMFRNPKSPRSSNGFGSIRLPGKWAKSTVGHLIWITGHPESALPCCRSVCNTFVCLDESNTWALERLQHPCLVRWTLKATLEQLRLTAEKKCLQNLGNRIRIQKAFFADQPNYVYMCLYQN